MFLIWLQFFGAFCRFLLWSIINNHWLSMNEDWMRCKLNSIQSIIVSCTRIRYFSYTLRCIFAIRCCNFVLKCQKLNHLFHVNSKALYPSSAKKWLKWTRVYYFVNCVNVKLTVKKNNITQHLKTDKHIQQQSAIKLKFKKQ